MNMTEKKIWTFVENFPWFWLGLVITLLLILPYFVLGSGSYVQITDQLDGEVINYIYRAKYLFSGEGVIPEFMNGMSKSAMTPPAPIGVLFYRLLPPFAAFAALHIYAVLTGYVGMYLLCRQLTRSPFISFVTAGIFVYLPFYPVYGLSILGQPLLVWALIKICSQKIPLSEKWKYYLCIVLYAVSSSLALVGFAWVMIFLLIWLRAVLRKQTMCRESGIAFFLLLAAFLICNADLGAQILGLGDNFVAHREEMTLAAMPDWQSYFGEIFLEGGIYGKSYNAMIALFTAILLIACPTARQIERKFTKPETKRQNSRNLELSTAYKCLTAIFALTLLLTAGAVLWRTQWVIDLRTQIGGVVKYFQADRIYWLLPLCWYTLLALDLYILLREWKKFWPVRFLAATATVATLCFTVYQNSTIYHNLRLMIFPDTYQLMDWDDYYAEDVYRQIDQFIGKDKATYRTLSLGINPAAALYNGFYCLDGYSNYYALDYKHEFREIIAAELAKNEESRVYFDTWGNRCYLLNSETGNYMTIAGNTGATYQNLTLDTQKAYDMGARYLFAAMPIDNADEMNLVLAREEPFFTEDSYYSIWLYQIELEP